LAHRKEKKSTCKRKEEKIGVMQQQRRSQFFIGTDFQPFSETMSPAKPKQK
jgi:hypothetical protein